MNSSKKLKSSRHIRRLIKNAIEDERVKTKKTIYERTENSNSTINVPSVDCLEDLSSTSTSVSDDVHTANVFGKPDMRCYDKPSVSVSNKEVPSYADENISSSKLFFVSSIKAWILRYRHLLSQAAINELLDLLIREGYNVPKDSRTILKTPKTCNMIDVNPGKYFHIGVETGLKNITRSDLTFKLACSYIKD